MVHTLDFLDKLVAGNAPECQETHYKHWKSSGIDSLEMVETNEHRHSYPYHLHEALEVIWVKSGSALIYCRGKVSTIESGEACVISPNECHGGGCHGKASIEFTSIHIPFNIVHQFAQLNRRNFNALVYLRPVKIISSGCAGRILPKLISGLKDQCSGQAQREIATQSLEKLLFARSLPRSQVFGMTESHPAVDRVKSIICRNYAETIDIAMLASEVQLNKRYLISLFKFATGITPHQFLIGIRVDHARRLIHSNFALGPAAVETGFADQSHLNRYFKRQWGMTPGAYRRHGDLT